jgi:dihydroorotate dehydrogenase electron transfer subunit
MFCAALPVCDTVFTTNVRRRGLIYRARGGSAPRADMAIDDAGGTEPPPLLEGVVVQLYSASIVENSQARPGVQLITVHVPALAQAVQPGQYVMVRCCHAGATDPLLRRPFFIHSVNRTRGDCSLLVQERGRGTAWLTQQLEGMTLDISGPLGHGWELQPTAGNLLLIAEDSLIPGLTLLAQIATEQERAVTLLASSERAADIYPPALLPAEVEYHIITADDGAGQQGTLLEIVGRYLSWADAAFCSVTPRAAIELYHHHEKMRGKRFAQAVLLHPLVCAAGTCLTCALPTASGTKLLCRDGPVFALREIARAPLPS